MPAPPYSFCRTLVPRRLIFILALCLIELLDLIVWLGRMCASEIIWSWNIFRGRFLALAILGLFTCSFKLLADCGRFYWNNLLAYDAAVSCCSCYWILVAYCKFGVPYAFLIDKLRGGPHSALDKFKSLLRFLNIKGDLTDGVVSFIVDSGYTFFTSLLLSFAWLKLLSFSLVVKTGSKLRSRILYKLLKLEYVLDGETLGRFIVKS